MRMPVVSFSVFFILIAGTIALSQEYLWLQSNENKDWLMLQKDEKVIGWYDQKLKSYRPLLGHRNDKDSTPIWGQPEKPPIEPSDPVINYGVDLSKVNSKKGITTNGGKEITREEVFRMFDEGRVIGDKEIPDYKSKFRFIIVGENGQTKKIVDDYEADRSLDSIRPQISLWVVPPDHHSLKDNYTDSLMYPLETNPTLIVEAPNGQVKDRWRAAYTGPQEFGRLRKAVQGYDPKKDPDLSKTGLLTGTDPSVIIIGIAGLITLIMFVMGSGAKNGN